MFPDHFTGQVSISFDLNNKDTDLFLDYYNQELLSLSINEVKQDSIKWDGLFITLPKESLKDSNVVHAEFKCKYANDGSGFH